LTPTMANDGPTGRDWILAEPSGRHWGQETS